LQGQPLCAGRKFEQRIVEVEEFWIGRDDLCQRPGKMLCKERAELRRDQGKGADSFFGTLTLWRYRASPEQAGTACLQ
jgi:hypothetical protein